MMTRFKLILLCISAITLYVACVPQTGIPIDRPTPTQDPELLEAAVYREVISELYPEGKMFFVFDKTKSGVSILINDLQGFKEETLEDYEGKNLNKHPINTSLELESEMILTNLSELWRQYKINDPQETLELDFVAIQNDYPQFAGILELSKVGFDSTYEQALVDVALFSTACSEHTVVLLSKTNDLWEITDSNYGYECG